MENSYVLPGLVKRRAALAGDLETAEARVLRLRADLAALDAVILQFDPDHRVDIIRATRRRAQAGAGFAAMSRAVLDALRRAGRPLTSSEIAGQAIAERGLDTESRAVRAAMVIRVGRALRDQRAGGAVRAVRRVGRSVLWELAAD